MSKQPLGVVASAGGTDMDKSEVKKVVKNEQAVRRIVWKFKKNNMKARFQKRVKNIDAPDIWNDFRNGVLKACDEVCGKKKGRRNHGDTWRWKEEVKEEIRQKKEACKKMCKNQLEENKARYKEYDKSSKESGC